MLRNDGIEPKERLASDRWSALVRPLRLRLRDLYLLLEDSWDTRLIGRSESESDYNFCDFLSSLSFDGFSRGRNSVEKTLCIGLRLLIGLIFLANCVSKFYLGGFLTTSI